MEKEEEIVSAKKPRKKHHALYVFSISALLLIAAILATLIYGRNNPEGQIFGVPFAQINAKFDSFLGIFSPDITSDKDKPVQGETKYQHIKDNYYVTDDQSVRALTNGVINNVSKEGESYFVLLSYNNGVTAYYYELIDLVIKNNDVLSASDIIGGYEEQFKVIFKKNGQVISYEEAIS